LFADK